MHGLMYIMGRSSSAQFQSIIAENALSRGNHKETVGTLVRFELGLAKYKSQALMQTTSVMKLTS
jgi:hypothetical protein